MEKDQLAIGKVLDRNSDYDSFRRHSENALAGLRKFRHIYRQCEVRGQLKFRYCLHQKREDFLDDKVGWSSDLLLKRSVFDGNF